MDAIDVFKLPYFITAKDGERHPRARIFLDWLADKDSAPVGVSVALHDFLGADVYLVNDADRHALSESVLSALALGAAIAGDPNFAALASILRDRARIAAAAQHKGNGNKRQRALAWYAEHRGEYKTKDDAATALTKIIAVEWSTARRWLQERRRT